MKEAYLNTGVGLLRFEVEENALTTIEFSEGEEVDSDPADPLLQECIFQMKAYFKGHLKEFDLPINLKGTEFQKKVWQKLIELPYGSTDSYLNLARNLGDVKAIRAVASANGKNPIPIVVPCHRIIGSDGSLTGYSGGLWRKKYLLEMEAEEKQMKLFE